MVDWLMNVMMVFDMDTGIIWSMGFVCLWLLLSVILSVSDSKKQHLIDTILIWMLVTGVLIVMAIGLSHSIFSPYLAE